MSSMLHILDVCAMGGAEKMLLEILQIAGEHNKPYHFITFQQGTLDAEFRLCKCYYNHIPRKKALDFSTIKQLRNYIIEHKIKTVHTHEPVSALYVQLAARRLSIYTVHTYHGYMLKPPLRDRLSFLYCKSRIDMHIFVSNDVYESFKKRFGQFRAYQVIENGTNVNITASKSDIRQELGLDDSAIVFGMIGSFNFVRDQLTICKAIDTLIKKGLKIYCLFLGRKIENYPSYDECVNYCDKNDLNQYIHFLGERKDAISILLSLNAYVYASNHDTFGLTIIEAMAVGIPVFTNNLPPIAQITRNGKFATLYETKDYIQLANALESFIQQPQAYLSMAEQAKEHVKVNYSIERVWREYQEIYNEQP